MRRAIQVTAIVVAVVVGTFLAYLALRQEKGPSGASTPSTMSELPPISRAEVTITCSPSIVGARGDLFGTSVNVPRWVDGSHSAVNWDSGFLSETEGVLAEHVREVGPGVKLRFGYQPFDGYLDAQGKVQGGYRWREALDGRNGQMSIDDYLAFAGRVGAEPQVVVNLATGTAQEAADLVAYLNGTDPSDPMVSLRRQRGRAEPYAVRVFEIGADTWARDSAGREAFADGTPGSRDPASLGRRIVDFAGAMRRRSASEVRLYAPVTSWDLDTYSDPALRRLIGAVAPAVDGYALSFYATEGEGETIDAPVVAASAWRLGRQVDALRSTIRAASPGRVGEIVVTQWTPSRRPSAMGRNWLTGQLIADSAVTMSDEGVAVANYFAESSPRGAAGGYSYWLDGDPAKPAPSLVATQVTSKHLGRELLDTRTTGVEQATVAGPGSKQIEFPSLGARCSRRDYDSYLVVVNRTPKPRQANVALEFAVAGPIAATQLVSPTSAQTVDVARVTYQPSDRFNLDLPPYSATYLRIPLA